MMEEEPVADMVRETYRIIRKAMDYIPKDCEYSRAVNALMGFNPAHVHDCWRKCYDYIHENYG